MLSTIVPCALCLKRKQFKFLKTSETIPIQVINKEQLKYKLVKNIRSISKI